MAMRFHLGNDEITTFFRVQKNSRGAFGTTKRARGFLGLHQDFEPTKMEILPTMGDPLRKCEDSAL